MKTGGFYLALCLMIPASAGITLAASEKLPTTTILISPEVKLEAELAITDEARVRGLMFRKSLPADAGMLFVFPNLDYHYFWMKNTLIPLDILWLNEWKEIVYSITVEPCKKEPCPSYAPLQKAKYVLEVNAGFMKSHHMKLGQQLEFSLASIGEQ